MLPKDFQVPAVKVYPDWDKPTVGVVRGKFEEKTNTLLFDPSYKEMGLTMIHELGHAMDWKAGKGDFASNVPGTVQNEIVKQLRHTETSKGYWRSDKDTGFLLDPETQSDDEVVYEIRRREVFARGYAQEAAYRMENAKLIKHIEAFQSENKRQWSKQEFESVRMLFKKLFPYN